LDSDGHKIGHSQTPYGKGRVVLPRPGVLETTRLYMTGERNIALSNPKFRGVRHSDPAPAAFMSKSMFGHFPPKIWDAVRVSSLRPIFRRGCFLNGPCMPNSVFPTKSCTGHPCTLTSHTVSDMVGSGGVG
jgi:hypothetical protein